MRYCLMSSKISGPTFTSIDTTVNTNFKLKLNEKWIRDVNGRKAKNKLTLIGSLFVDDVNLLRGENFPAFKNKKTLRDFKKTLTDFKKTLWKTSFQKDHKKP